MCCAPVEFWRHPSWRTSLDACVATEVPEQTLHFWRQPVERTAPPIRSHGADPYSFLQQPAPHVALHENQTILLILENFAMHNMEVVPELPGQFRLAKRSS